MSGIIWKDNNISCIITSSNLNGNDHLAPPCHSTPPVIPRSHQSTQGCLHLLQFLPPQWMWLPMLPGQHWYRAAGALARAVGITHGTAQRGTPSPLLLVPVPYYLDPDLASLTWCPVPAGQTCLIAGDLPGSLGCQLILGATPGPALLLLWGFVGLQPRCSPACLAATQLPSHTPLVLLDKICL